MSALGVITGFLVVFVFLWYREYKHIKKRSSICNRALDMWSSLDKEHHRHVLLYHVCVSEGRMAEARWHRRMVETLEPQVERARFEYDKTSDLFHA